MLIGAIGASAVSQLYQSLTGQGTDGSSATTTTTAPNTRAPTTTAASTPAAAPTLTDSANKLIGDLNTFLLNLQAANGTPASTATTAASTTGADPTTPGTAAASTSGVPPSPLQSELSQLNEAPGKTDGTSAHHHHHHAHASAPDPSSTAASTTSAIGVATPAASASTNSGTSASSSDSLFAQFAKALSAYASNLGNSTTTQLSV